MSHFAHPAYEIDIEEDGAGGAWVTHWTNDNHDDGSCDEDASWREHWKDAERAKQSLGKSRIGCTGMRVDVRVNGKRV